MNSLLLYFLSAFTRTKLPASVHVEAYFVAFRINQFVYLALNIYTSLVFKVLEYQRQWKSASSTKITHTGNMEQRIEHR